MADVRGLLKDDDFWSVTPDERRQILGSLDQDFAALTLSEQDEFLGTFRPTKDEPFVKTFLKTPVELAIGAGKGAMSTVMGAGDVLRKLAPSLPELPPGLEQEFERRLEPVGQQQQVGKFIEQAGEYFIPGGTITRGMKVVRAAMAGKKGAKAASIGARAVMEAASVATVTAAQTGGDPEAITAAGAVSGAISTILGMPFERVKRFIPTERLLSAEFGVRLTQAKQTQNWFLSQWEALIRRAFGGQGIFHKFDLEANSDAVKAAEGMSRWLGGSKLSSFESGAFVQKTIQDVLDMSGSVYNRWVDQYVVPHARNIKIPLEQLQTAAKSIRALVTKPGEISPSTIGTEGVQRTLSILDEVLALEKNPSWEAAWRTRSRWFKMSQRGEIDLGSGQLQRLNSALDASMIRGLRQAGRPDLAKAFRYASDKFRETHDLVEGTVLKSLLKSKTPEAVIRSLITKGRSETVSRELAKAIDLLPATAKKRAQRQMQTSVWEEILDVATVEGDPTEKILIGDKLAKTTAKLGRSVLERVFPEPGKLPRVRKLVRLLDVLDIRPGLAKPQSSQTATLMAFAAGQGVAGYLVGGAAVGFNDPRAFMVALAAVLGPAGVAKFMTRPGAVEVSLGALQATPGTPAATKAMTRLGGMLAAHLSGYEEPETGITVK